MSLYFPFFFTLLSGLLLKDLCCSRSTVLDPEEAGKCSDLNGLLKRIKPPFAIDLYQYKESVKCEW
jgi:hypothetical protein